MKKNTAFNRYYQSFTTRYNVYFNGNESFKQELDKMEKDFKDNYTALLFLHPVSQYANTKTEALPKNFDRAITKCQKAIRLHSIQAKPVKNQKKINDPKYKAWYNRSEFNPFIHRAWLLMGQAQYYKGDFLGSATTFNYIQRHFHWMPDLVAECRIMKARCYAEMGWLYEAENELTEVNRQPYSDKLKGLYAGSEALLMIKQGRYSHAANSMGQTIRNQKRGIQKSRMQFLQAQLYALSNQSNEAYNAYEQVIKNNPPYVIELNARIKQTEVAPIGDYSKTIKRLNRMLRDDKNKEYLDQIHYAIGNIYLKQKDTAQAIKNYELAAEKSTRNGIEKAVGQLTLGRLYFSMGRYDKAQPCYADALSGIDKEYPNYESIALRSSVLDKLAVPAENVALQDSLLILASRPEAEQKKVIAGIIKEIERKEKEEKEKADQERFLAQQNDNSTLANMQNRPGAAKPTTPTINISGDNSWYFYNSSIIAQGKGEFQRKWGSRKLEDHWRRKNKASYDLSDLQAENTQSEKTDNPNAETQTTDSGVLPQNNEQVDNKDPKSDDPKDPQFYLQQLPRTEAEIENANNIIADGLLEMGIILKDDLEDFSLASQNLNKLERRYPNSPLLLEAYYHLYLIYARLGNQTMQEKYRQLIISRYPDSEYGITMSQENYLKNLLVMDTQVDSIYQETYAAYLNNQTHIVHRQLAFVEQAYPMTRLMPKFMLLSAMSYIAQNNIPKFKEVLQSLLERYTEGEVSTFAGEILKGLSEGKQVVTGGQTKRTFIWDIPLSNPNDSTATAQEIRPFTWQKETPYYYILAFSESDVSANELLYRVAKYNFSNFLVNDFDLEIVRFNEITLLIIKEFYNFDQLSQYRRMSSRPNGLILENTIRPIAISQSNWEAVTSGRTLQEYFDYETEQQLKEVAAP